MSNRKTSKKRTSVRSRTAVEKCQLCEHGRDRHTMAGCIGGTEPGANCACDEFETP